MRLVPYREQGWTSGLFCLCVKEGDMSLTLAELQELCVEAVGKVPGLEMVVPVSHGRGFISFDVVPQTRGDLLAQFIIELNKVLARRDEKQEALAA